MAGKVRRRLWRWRRGPLRRRSDVTEAWAGLVAWVLIALCGPAAGVVTAVSYQEAVLGESHDWRSVSAVLIEDAGAGGLAAATTTGGGRASATVAWLTPDGVRRTGEALVTPGSEAGDTVTVSLDEHGRLQDAPSTAAGESLTGGIAAGLVAAAGVCAAVLIAHRALRRRLDVRRWAAWEREWAEVGPRWSDRSA